jgi:hypothetical protein
MKCRQVKLLLDHYCHCELEDSERVLVEAHLADCPACREVAREYKSLQAASSEASVPGLSPEFLEEFRRETVELARSSGRLDPSPARPGRPTRRTGGIFGRAAARPPIWLSRWRFAALGASALVAVALAVVYFSGRTVQSPADLPTVDSFLARADFRGLGGALADPGHRRAILSDTVSVALLLKSVDRLDRPSAHAVHLKRSATRVLCDLMTERLDPATIEKSIENYRLSRTDVCTSSLDLDEIRRALRQYRHSGKRIAVRDIIKVLSNSIEA